MRKMKPRQKKTSAGRACRWIAAAVLALAPATSALAARDEVPDEPVDARLEGYAQNMTLPESSHALTWIAFIVLAAIAAGGLFKDAKRSHLD
jgi:hypothetical protein